MPPATFEQAVDLALSEMRAVLIARQRKYGSDNIRQAGLLGVLNRVAQDKLARLRRVYEREHLRAQCLNAGMPAAVVDEYLPAIADFADEAVDDAHLDAANYIGPISLMLRRGWWGLPLEGD